MNDINELKKIYYFNYSMLDGELLGKNGGKLNCQTLLRSNSKQKSTVFVTVRHSFDLSSIFINIYTINYK